MFLSVFAAAWLVACVVSFICGKTASGVIAIVQLLSLGAILFVENIVLQKRNIGIKIMAVLLSIVLALAFLGATVSDEQTTHYNWSEIRLSEFLPEPPSEKAKISVNSEDDLSMEIFGLSDAIYEDYISDCEKAGYDIDAVKESYSYSAKSSNGFLLELKFSDSELSMIIGLHRLNGLETAESLSDETYAEV